MGGERRLVSHAAARSSSRRPRPATAGSLALEIFNPNLHRLIRVYVPTDLGIRAGLGVWLLAT